MPGVRLIIVFAKAATPGSVKTRLIPPFTAQEAAAFHLASLSDVVAAARDIENVAVELHITGEPSAVEGLRRGYPGLAVRRQVGDDLGLRLEHAFDGAFRRRVERALIVGSDHPTLPSAYLREVFAWLDAADVVFGPSQDGGYYAVGARRSAWPRGRSVFRDIPWSSPAVLEISQRRAREAELTVALAPEWYDVDGQDDLERLVRDAPSGSRAAAFLRDWARSRR